MDDDSKQIIESMAVVEDKIMELYAVFSDKFPMDASLWSKLSQEEKMHAGMIRTLGDMIRSQDVKFQKDRFNLKSLQNLVLRLSDEIQKATNNFFNRKSALEFALKLEQTLVEKKSFEAFESDIADMKKLFGILMQETQKHAKEIQDYMVR